MAESESGSSTPDAVLVFVDLGRQLRELESRLRAAFDAATPADMEPAAADRARLVLGLRAIDLFIRGTLPAHLATQQAILNLAAALQNLDDGIVDDLLAPVPVKGKRHDSTIRWRARAHVVLAIEAMVATGLSIEQAAQAVQRRHKWIVALQGKRGGELSSTVRNWVERFRSGAIQDEISKASYAAGLHALKKVSDDKKSELADQLLRQVAQGLRINPRP